MFEWEDVVTAKRVVIIGAGFGGLSLGIRLQAAGFDTTIVEALDKPGGWALVSLVYLPVLLGVLLFDHWRLLQ